MTSVAIDGPSGAGKSTLAKQAAETLHFLYVDTGAIYRTVGLWAQRNNVPVAAPEGIIPLLEHIQIDLRHGTDGLQHMYLEQDDVSDEIRAPEISLYASTISTLPAVRTFLMGMQRELAQRNDVIMDGRDIGTVVLPGADVKIYLTAAPEDRAQRRYTELLERGNKIDYATVLRELQARDAKDTGRAVAPLRRAADAVLLDTTGKSLEESLQLLLATIRGRLK